MWLGEIWLSYEEVHNIYILRCKSSIRNRVSILFAIKTHDHKMLVHTHLMEL